MAKFNRYVRWMATVALLTGAVAWGMGVTLGATKSERQGASAKTSGTIDLSRLEPANREELTALTGTIPGPNFTQVFDKRVAFIPMRDGVKLRTDIYTPKHQSGALPIIVERSPYCYRHDQYGYSPLLREYGALIRDGYIFAFQGVRGRCGSGGQFYALGPLTHLANSKATDDSTDAYDTIGWLVKNVPHNNGRAGILGISYDAYLVTRALVDPNPALKAASPQATCAEMFIGDDWHHNGAFRLDYSFNWIGGMEAARLRGAAALEGYDNYSRFLRLGPLSNVNRLIFHGQAPSWNGFAEHPNLDRYWQTDSCDVIPYIQPVSVPTLNVLGWFDAEDFYGALKTYEKYQSLDSKGLNYLIVGPWYHGGWSFSPGRFLRDIDFGHDTARWYRDEIQARWFRYWLKGEGTLGLPKVMAFRAGTNVWEQYTSWPPKEGVVRQKLYLSENFGLSFTPPTATGGSLHDDYISDPAKPVPYTPRPVTYNGWPTWKEVDQRFVDGRPDVLTYESQALKEDITISGDVVAHVFAATSGSDADWVVKLIDVYPDPDPSRAYMSGYEFMVADAIFRARYRHSFAKPEPVVPGKVTSYQISLRDRDYTFKKGHRLMVQIQSTWFPLYDRNPQRFVPNIYDAVAADFQKATQSIYRSGQYQTYLSLPVNTRPPELLPKALHPGS